MVVKNKIQIIVLQTTQPMVLIHFSCKSMINSTKKKKCQSPCIYNLYISRLIHLDGY